MGGVFFTDPDLGVDLVEQTLVGLGFMSQDVCSLQDTKFGRSPRCILEGYAWVCCPEVFCWSGLAVCLSQSLSVRLSLFLSHTHTHTREIRKVRFVANFEYVPQVLTPICPHHQNEKAPKIISIIYQNQIVS